MPSYTDVTFYDAGMAGVRGCVGAGEGARGFASAFGTVAWRGCRCGCLPVAGWVAADRPVEPGGGVSGEDRVEREWILRWLYRNLGWLLAEFCLMPGYTRENTQGFLRYTGWNATLRRGSGAGVC